jgi:hypothetical protein
VCFAGGIELIVANRGACLCPSAVLVPGPAYDAEQLEAEQTQGGQWSGPFVPSWEWRKPGYTTPPPYGSPSWDYGPQQFGR